MSKRRSIRYPTITYPKRDIIRITNAPRALFSTRTLRPTLMINLPAVEDRRSRIWRSPLTVKNYKTVSGNRVAFRHRVTSSLRHFIDAPRTAIVCVRRKIRREVLFSLRRGSGMSFKTPRRRTEVSRYSC